MADFGLRITSGVTVKNWSDPAFASAYVQPPQLAPSRLNAPADIPHSYWKASPGGTVVFQATVGGVEGPLDGALGGRLFVAAWVQTGGPWPPIIVQNPGISSVATVALPANAFGHFMMQFLRPDGGCVAIPFEVEA